MKWELKKVEDIECTMDDSGVYVVINRVKVGSFDHRFDDYPMLTAVRADLMTASHEPIMSWQGSANAVRKHLIRFLADPQNFGADIRIHRLSLEHASYIGYELLRAETDRHYVQD